MVWAMSFPPGKLDRLSINITSNVFSTLETVVNSVECSYQIESSMKNTKNYSRAVRLQPPPLYGLLAPRRISYGKSKCSHIFYAKPLAIRTGVGAMQANPVSGASKARGGRKSFANVHTYIGEGPLQKPNCDQQSSRAGEQQSIRKTAQML